MALGLVGCRALLPVPDLRTPVDRAHELEPRCKGFDAAAVAPLLAGDAVDKVEPAYSYVQSGNDRRVNLRGAQIHVRPLPGLSRESIERSLECHQVGAVLGAEKIAADDPYVLPGRWVSLDVDSEGDGFVVLVRVDALDDAKEILARARTFAARRENDAKR
jgi:hypothetical protein